MQYGYEIEHASAKLALYLEGMYSSKWFAPM